MDELFCQKHVVRWCLVGMFFCSFGVFSSESTTMAEKCSWNWAYGGWWLGYGHLDYDCLVASWLGMVWAVLGWYVWMKPDKFGGRYWYRRCECEATSKPGTWYSPAKRPLWTTKHGEMNPMITYSNARCGAGSLGRMSSSKCLIVEVKRDASCS